MKDAIRYFAYGSNLDLEHLSDLKVKLIHMERAILNDYKLVFNVLNSYKVGVGYANISPHKGATTEGLIIYTDPASVRYLGDYEGFPVLYKKQALSVIKEDRQQEAVMAYIGNGKVIYDNLKPTRSHLTKILNGRKFLSGNYFEQLLTVEVL